MEFKTKPFDHQLQTLEKIKDKDYFALFWEMGTGKTKEAVDFLRYKCYQKKQVLRTLIVCPKIATYNWKKEIEMHSSLVKQAEILVGTKSKRLKLLNNRSKNIFIINFEGTVTLHKELLQKWDLIIVDESQRIKNFKAKQSKSLVQIGSLSNYRLILSGTPILNTPMDIFNQYLFLDHGATFGTNFFSFRNEYFNRIDIQLGKDGARFPKFVLFEHKKEQLHRKIMGIADVRKKCDCLDLPEKIYQTIKLEMGVEQQKAYKEMLKDLITIYKENPEFTMIASTAAVKLMRLRQISSGFMKIEETKEEIAFSENPKLEAIKEILEDITINHKVIIWACFIKDIEMLQKELSKYNPVAIYGGTKDKQIELTKFTNDKTCRVIICEPRSSSLAINLVQASYAIYYSQGFELEFRAQSEDRCHRSGSEIHDKITYIDLEFPSSIDCVISKALKSKSDMKDSLIKIIEETISEEDI